MWFDELCQPKFNFFQILKPSVRRSWNSEGQLMIMMTLVVLLVMMTLVMLLVMMTLMMMMMLMMMMLVMMMLMLVLMMACTCPALHPIPSYVFPHFYLLPWSLFSSKFSSDDIDLSICDDDQKMKRVFKYISLPHPEQSPEQNGEVPSHLNGEISIWLEFADV